MPEFLEYFTIRDYYFIKLMSAINSHDNLLSYLTHALYNTIFIPNNLP